MSADRIRAGLAATSSSGDKTLERVIGAAADRISVQLGKVMADVARVERAKDGSPILLTRLLAHQAQLLEQQRHLAVWGARDQLESGEQVAALSARAR